MNDESKALTLAAKRLVWQACSTAKLIEYLRKKGFSQTEIDDAVEKCVAYGWLSDKEWIAAKMRSLVRKKKSRFEIIQYFKREGFSLVDIEPYLPKDNRSSLKLLIQQRYPCLLDKTCDEKARRRALAALCRRGFQFDEIRTLAGSECE